MLRSPPLNKEQSASDSNIMIRASVVDDNSLTNITMRDKRRRLSDECYDELTAFKMEMRELFQGFQDAQNKKFDLLNKYLEEVKSQTTSIHTTNKDIEKSLEFMNDQLGGMQSRIDGLEDQRKNLSLEIFAIEEKCEHMEKSLKSTSIELRFVPKVQTENKEMLFKYIENLSKNLNIVLHPGDVRDVYRIPNKKDPTKLTIVAELSNTLIKSNLLNSVRKFKKNSELKVSHLGINNDSTALFVSESLTSKARRLHFLAREFARTENYRFCWTSHGNIYLKKQEGSSYILIKNESQFNDLKQPK